MGDIQVGAGVGADGVGEGEVRPSYLCVGEFRSIEHHGVVVGGVVGVSRLGEFVLEVEPIVAGKHNRPQQLAVGGCIHLLVPVVSPQSQPFCLYDLRVKQLGTVGSFLGVDIEHHFDDLPEFGGVGGRNSGDLALSDLFEEAFHALGLEGRFESDHLVEHTAERPDITLDVVGLVLPDLGTGVVRSAGLGEVESVFGADLAHIHVAQFRTQVFIQKHIRTLQVSVHDVKVVHGFQALSYLNEHLPYEFFRQTLVLLVWLRHLHTLSLEQLRYLVVEVTHVHQLHYDAQGLLLSVHESFFVTDYVGVVDGGQDAHLVDGVLSLFLGQLL